MLEGTLYVYAFFIVFPLSCLAGILLLIRYYIRKTEWCESDEKLEGKTIIVTGGSSGIGRALCVELARRGARVVVACRTKARRDSTGWFLRSKTGSFNVRVMYVDFTSLDSVWEFAREVVETEERVDMIVNNSAILCQRDNTPDGLDMMMGVNYVGHFLLSNLLEDKLKDCGPVTPARVINVLCGSFQHGNLEHLHDIEGKSGTYSYRQAYRNSKLALFLFTKELAKIFPSEYIVTVAVDPGLVNSGLYRHIPGIYGKIYRWLGKVLYRTPEEAMQTILHCILAKDICRYSGRCFKDCKVLDIRRTEWNDHACTTLWEKTASVIRGKGISFSLKEADEEEEEEE